MIMNQDAKSNQNKVVYTSGCWDLFHVGHLRSIQRAKTNGGILIVGVLTDELITTYKKRPPLESFTIRYEIISNLPYPDLVLPEIRQFDLDRLANLGVTNYLIGADWENSNDPNLLRLKEVIKVTFLPRTVGVSTSNLRSKLGK
jgi:choline-phosphate cytidylyltransferase/glycerol-3-phosphate cytidylyltransferase